MTTDTELFPPPEPRWEVVTIHQRQTKAEIAADKPKYVSHHELLYGVRVQKRTASVAGLEGLREMAAFLNRKRMAPRPAVQCLADEPGNLEAAMRRMTKRSDAINAKAASAKYMEKHAQPSSP